MAACWLRHAAVLEALVPAGLLTPYPGGRLTCFLLLLAWYIVIAGLIEHRCSGCLLRCKDSAGGGCGIFSNVRMTAATCEVAMRLRRMALRRCDSGTGGNINRVVPLES
jgi:hypothetical protein